MQLTHFDENGKAIMVDVTEQKMTQSGRLRQKDVSW